MKPFKNITIILAFVLLIAYGCYPGGPESTNDFTIVKTQYNTGYEFEAQKTYYLPDSMLFYTNIDAENLDEAKVRAYEIVLLKSIKDNMAAHGYTLETTDTTKMDLVVLPSAVLVKNTSASWWPGYGGWGGYYPPGWGGGGWYYPPGYGGYWSYSSYTTGTVFITMIDYDSYDPDENSSVEVEWEALIDGLFNGVDASKIDGLVTKAFNQSPYLKSN